MIFRTHYLLVGGPAHGEVIQKLNGTALNVPIPTQPTVQLVADQRLWLERPRICTYTLRDVTITDNIHFRVLRVLQPEHDTTITHLPSDLCGRLARP